MFSLYLYRRYEKSRWRRVDAAAAEFIMDAPRDGAGQRRDIALVLICKNVAEDIDEWVRFHELAGVKHFYIYDNGSTDGTVAKARRHDGGGIAVRVLPWSLVPAAAGHALPAQELAYAHAALNWGHRHRWMAFIDIDEFIFPRRHATIGEALEDLSGFSCVTLPWRQFGHCGHQTRPADPCIFAYQLRHQQSGYSNEHFKCIVDPSKIHTSSVHYFFTSDMGRTEANDQGQVAPFDSKWEEPGFISSKNLQLNHYRTKSIAENQAKARLVKHGELPYFRTPKVLQQIEELGRDTTLDEEALRFLAKRGINSCAEYQDFVNGG